MLSALLLTSCTKSLDKVDCDKTNLATFVPRGEWNGNTWPIDRSIESKIFYDNLEKVLDHYNVRYERVSVKSLKASCEIVVEPEIIHNFTSKAQDKEWLENKIHHRT